MVGKNPDNTVCAANVWSFSCIFVNSVWASSFHRVSVVSVWVFRVVVDMSQRLWPDYLLLLRGVKETLRRSPPRSPHLCSPQKWCQDNSRRGVCAASHQLWKLKATLSPDFYSSPTRLISLSLRFPLCLNYFLMLPTSLHQSITCNISLLLFESCINMLQWSCLRNCSWNYCVFTDNIYVALLN